MSLQIPPKTARWIVQHQRLPNRTAPLPNNWVGQIIPPQTWLKLHLKCVRPTLGDAQAMCPKKIL